MWGENDNGICSSQNLPSWALLWPRSHDTDSLLHYDCSDVLLLLPVPFFVVYIPVFWLSIPLHQRNCTMMVRWVMCVLSAQVLVWNLLVAKSCDKYAPTSVASNIAPCLSELHWSSGFIISNRTWYPRPRYQSKGKGKGWQHEGERYNTELCEHWELAPEFEEEVKWEQTWRQVEHLLGTALGQDSKASAHQPTMYFLIQSLFWLYNLFGPSFFTFSWSCF